MIGLVVLVVCVITLVCKLNDMLVVQHSKHIVGSSGRCEDCGVKSNIRYEYKGKLRCQFCDDEAMCK